MALMARALTFFFSSRRRHTRYWRDWSFRRVLFRSALLSPPRRTCMVLWGQQREGVKRRREGAMGVESGFAAVNGTRLYYEVAGEGTPVALIHGFTLDTRMWDDQFLPLAAHYRVVRYDARGFGRSDLPTGEPYSPHDDLRALLEHLGLGPAAITGLSMGGGIAADFAIA